MKKSDTAFGFDKNKKKQIDHVWVTFRDNSIAEKIIKKSETTHPYLVRLKKLFGMKVNGPIKFDENNK